MDSWKELAEYLVMLVIGGIGFVLKYHNRRVNELSDKKVDKDDFNTEQERRRQDIKDLHSKIEKGQFETTQRLDRILEKVS